jgi:hypothetical protein
MTSGRMRKEVVTANFIFCWQVLNKKQNVSWDNDHLVEIKSYTSKHKPLLNKAL